NDEVFLQFDRYPAAGSRIRLLDAFGRVLQTQTVTSPTERIRRGELAGGLYFVEFEGLDGSRLVRPLVFE
ncbi:MAG TPA: hypothetical protein PLW66_14995, partial [Saprospiraceae bacterium]|nr:hypothetical protein [Saprospiraceae bacterium]